MLGLGFTFKQGIGQLEPLMFVGPGIEEHQGAGTEAFEPTDVVFAKAAPLVQAARVSEDMSAARSVDMEVNCLLANRTLGEKRVRSPPNQQLYELHNPYRICVAWVTANSVSRDVRQHLHKTKIVTARPTHR